MLPKEFDAADIRDFGLDADLLRDEDPAGIPDYVEMFQVCGASMDVAPPGGILHCREEASLPNPTTRACPLSMPPAPSIADMLAPCVGPPRETATRWQRTEKQTECAQRSSARAKPVTGWTGTR